MTAERYTFEEISNLGEVLAEAHFNTIGKRDFPIDPEIVIQKFFGLEIKPTPGLMTVGVKAGIDTTQSIIFIDEQLYMDERRRALSNQSIAHELGHAVFDIAAIRKLAAANAEEIYRLHDQLVSERGWIEYRAHKLGGAFLVPRNELIKQVALLLLESKDQICEIRPSITLEQLFEAMPAAKLTRYFCQSEDVIGWRMKDEDIYDAIGASADTQVSALSTKRLSQLAGRAYIPVPITERLKILLPPELPYSLQSTGLQAS